MKIGSLFDGSGGFPLAGALCGIEPVWAAEVEPYPIAVTRSRFPKMKHLGSVTDINGAEVEPVDIITFGSPCQDLSVAGKRAGLKHEDNGDEETTRSGLFMEAVRIIKEMREATNGEYPTFAVWENVPGAFSSNRGEDFRIVLEELIKIAEPTAVMPAVPKGGWAYADCYRGDGWSIGYRVLDAQYWGVPQRRRRIYLVADFGGERARKILFEREGLRGHLAESGAARKAAAAHAEGSAGADDRAVCYEPRSMKEENWTETAVKNALRAEASKSSHVIVEPVEQYLFENHSQDTRYKGPLDVCPMLPAQFGTGGNNTPFVVSIEGNGARPSHQGIGCSEDGKMYTLNTIERHAVAYGHPIAIDRAFFNQGQNAQYEPQYYEDGTVPTLVARGPSAVAVRYIVRRLTPTECARLQGFPDKWGHPDHKEDFTDKEWTFWAWVRNTHAAINGKATKSYTREQMVKWYNGLHTDSAEYKMWGNGIALPCARYVMEGIAEVCA